MLFILFQKKTLLKYTVIIIIIILNREGFSAVLAWYGAFNTFRYISQRF